jgi:hypothetical protein
MNGNGRWALTRGLPPTGGHREGAAALRTTVELALRAGVKTLTVYANPDSPVHELDAGRRMLGGLLAKRVPSLRRAGRSHQRHRQLRAARRCDVGKSAARRLCGCDTLAPALANRYGLLRSRHGRPIEPVQCGSWRAGELRSTVAGNRRYGLTRRGRRSFDPHWRGPVP